VYNEQLVRELAARDELEFEKESKNSFISQLLAVQAKRRQHQAAGKKQQRPPTTTGTESGFSRMIKKSPSSASLPQVEKMEIWGVYGEN